MDIIYNYLENMFNSLPKTKEIENLKNEIKFNMEEKFNELKNKGKSENEAIGIVISEFGNIDEITREFGIDEQAKEERFRELPLNEISNFYNCKKRSSFIISIGVMLCLFGISLSISLNQMMNTGFIFSAFSNDVKDFISVSIILICVVISVGLFIFAGTIMEKYKYIKKGQFSISNNTKAMLHTEIEKNKNKRVFGLILGVCICILAPMVIFISNIIAKNSGETYGISLLLILIAISVFLFINLGNINDGYKLILKEEEYDEYYYEQNKFIISIAKIIWPLATFIFLVWGFVFGGWEIAWIVFPGTAILLTILSRVYKGIQSYK